MCMPGFTIVEYVPEPDETCDGCGSRTSRLVSAERNYERRYQPG